MTLKIGKKVELVTNKPSIINFFLNPPFYVEQEAYLAYQEHNYTTTSNPDLEPDNYFKKQYTKTKNEVINKYNFKDKDKLYQKMLTINPITSVEIIKRDISKETLTKALDIFPELLLYGNIKNKEHLLLNHKVYSIINEYNNYDDDNIYQIFSPIIEKNIELLKQNHGTFNDLITNHNLKQQLDKYNGENILDLKKYNKA